MQLDVHLRCPHCGGWEVVETQTYYLQLEQSRADPERGPVCRICRLVPWTGLLQRPEDEYEHWIALCEGRIAPPTGPSNQIELMSTFARSLELMTPLVPLTSPEQLRSIVQTLEAAESMLVSARLAEAPLRHVLSVMKGNIASDQWPPELHEASKSILEREAARDLLENACAMLRAALDRVGRG